MKNIRILLLCTIAALGAAACSSSTPEAALDTTSSPMHDSAPAAGTGTHAPGSPMQP